jgi:hypothetical protein
MVFGLSDVSAIILAFVVYAVINAGWSMARNEALVYATMLFVVVICLHIGWAHRHGSHIARR